MNWFWFILGSLATFRLALMFSRESGPARIFRKLRNIPDPKSSLKEGLSCTLCESIWWGAVISGYYLWRENITAWEFPVVWLAMSAVAVLLHMKFTTQVGK